ncbi:MAG: hypothetical protein AAF602_13050 [Myxococcota bacterium]
MPRSLAQRLVEPRPEAAFVGRLTSRADRGGRIAASDRSLPTIDLGAPSPLLARLVETPIELEPGQLVRLSNGRRR